MEAITCHQILGGKIYLNQDFDPSSNAGIITVDYQEQKLRIDFLATVYGLNEVEIASTAIPFEGIGSLKGITLKVLHPILCLEGKVKCLNNLPQQGRQDLKHVQMSMLCLHQFLMDLYRQGTVRPFLKLVERIFTNALNETGLAAWYYQGIFLEETVPIDADRPDRDGRSQQFHEVRFPHFMQQLKSKRLRYQTLMEKVEQKRKNRGR